MGILAASPTLLREILPLNESVPQNDQAPRKLTPGNRGVNKLLERAQK
jgi:hypothetical protein